MVSRQETDAAIPAMNPASPWSPFRHTAFTVIWTATVVSNVGTWMYNAASGWLMTSLNPDPLIVSLVQVSTTLPIFLFAVPAGALADIVDKRKFLIVIEIAITVVAVAFATVVWAGVATALSLLLFTFLISALAALSMPAWQSVVPNLVPKQDLPHAVAANSVGINISRAIGPAAGGAIIGALGIAAPFWVNAVSNLGVVGALIWWQPPPRGEHVLPAERFGKAIRAGFRHARHNPHLGATLMRAVGFFLFASAYWALLPLVARHQISGGPELYGFLLGTIGTGAVIGAFALPRLRTKLGPDRLAAAGTLGTVATLVLFGIAREPVAALVASLIAGVSWIAMLATLNVSAQLALPDWVRGRGLAVFGTVFFGALTLGSAVWGQIAAMAGVPDALFVAAGGALLNIPLTWRWKLQTGATIDLSPSMHWPEPITRGSIPQDRGPVLVTVEYQVTPENRVPFLNALYRLAAERRRDGAYEWGVFEDSAKAGRFVEAFLVDSWLEHLRQHERVTNADREIQEIVAKYHVHGAPKVTHLIAADRDDRNGERS
jgi:MFS family permease